jgi:parallel beta-helix repeat protein
MGTIQISALRRLKIIALHLSLAITLAAGVLLSTTAVQASTTCTFTTSSSTMKLNANCTTDQTILIPNGFTLDGKGHSITAVDPPGDHFRGAVVKNAGAVAKVKNLTVTTSGLATVCDADADRLRGILFEGASGSIKDTIVRDIKQGPDGCQEGNAIEVRNAPFDGTHPHTQKVQIEDNLVSNYQKTGILANGDVSVEIDDNTVTGLGPVNFIAQNGIQFSRGALGKVEDNHVSGNSYTPQTDASSGILLYKPGNAASVKNNTVGTNDVGIWLIGANNARVKNNKVTGSVFDGIALDDNLGSEVLSGNRVDSNQLSHNGTSGSGAGIGLYGSGVTSNLIEKNTASSNDTGIFVGSGASGNKVTGNTAKDNARLDIENAGTNSYSKNKCKTSSGPPVDCGMPPPAPLAAGPGSAAKAPGGAAHRAQPFE